MTAAPELRHGRVALRRSNDRGESDGRLAIFVAVSLLVVAVPGVLVLRQTLTAGPHISAKAAGSVAFPSTAASSDTAQTPASRSLPATPSSAASTAPATAASPSSPTITAPAPTPSPPPVALDSLILAAAPGYSLSVDPNGRGLTGETTLDLCQVKFGSEAKRVTRLAVSYLDTNGMGPALEVVRYGPGGASMAYTELLDGAHHCPATYPDGPVTVTQTVVEPPDPSLLPNQLAVVQSARSNGVTVWGSVIFQVDGPYLAAAYSNPFSTKQAALATALYLARREAPLLQQAATGSRPTVAG
jgi:hypothetical protein